MAFDGKATYDDATSIHEDVSDLISLNSLLVTPFLDFVGTSLKPAKTTTYEWLVDADRPVADQLNEALDNSETGVDVDDGSKFVIGHVIMVDDELMLVTGVSANELTVGRAYGSSDAVTHDDNAAVEIITRAALEGDDAPTPRHTSRSRKSNYTQIIEPEPFMVSGTERAVSTIGVADEYELQKEATVRQALHMLERSALLGSKAASTPAGSDTVRRTMEGLRWWPTTNSNDESSAALTEARIREILRDFYNSGMVAPDFAICGAHQKQLISGFKQSLSQVAMTDTKHTVRTDIYESDFGSLRILLNRNMPADEIIIGTRANVKVVPLQGRSFFHLPLAISGDYKKGSIIGEYTLEVRLEETFGLIYNLATS